MRKILFNKFALTLLVIFPIIVLADDYYWYKDNKIYLEKSNREYIIYNDSLLLESDKKKLIHTENVSYPGHTNLKWGITRSNAIIEDLEHVLYQAPSYKGDEEGDIFVTHRFYVKLKQVEDFVLLQNLAAQYSVYLEQDIDLPLCYILMCGLPSSFNALELANIFYESGLFMAAEPEFIGGMGLDDTTAINQVTNNESKTTKKIFSNGVLIIESDETIYNILGKKIK